MTRTFPRRPRSLAALSLGLGLTVATVLAGCTSDGGGGDGDGGGESAVAFGASAAEYQAALADMDPVVLTIQSGAAAAGLPIAFAFDNFVERIEEYSGGKITFDVTYANGIISNVLEMDDGLLDGRLDISFFWPQYDPSEYPANNALIDSSVLRDPQAITGYYSAEAWMQEVGLGTPEIVAEWTNKGILPLNIMSPDGPSLILCSEPVTSLADFQGKQVRVGGTTHARQVQELGGIPVSLPYPEVYEALQRGILDCSMSAHSLATGSGHIEVAPYLIHTDGSSFASTPTNFYAGSRVLSLPPAARQLILEASQYMFADQFEQRLDEIAADTFLQVEEYGGAWLSFDAEFDARLNEINEGILADLESSSHFDGADLVSRAKAASAAWVAKVNELGYTDEGPISTFKDWHTAGNDYDIDSWTQAVLSEIFTQHAPI